MLRFFRGLLIVLLALVIVAAATAPLVVRRSFPKTDGQISLPGLDGTVDIYRDKFGIPHIYASDTHDLFFAQGYVHAQDRFWQMDFWRHTGSGRLAEMFGEDTLGKDKFLRTLGWARIAQQELDKMDPEGKAIMEAYAQGVNAYLADHQGSALSLEYAVLKLLNPGYQIEPWLPLHSLTWAKAMAWDLRGNMDQEIERAILLKSLSPQQVAQLYPPYPGDHPPIVPTPNTAAQFPTQTVQTALTNSNLAAALRSAYENVQRLDAMLGPAGAEVGSNNWVISGKLTASGKPFLANDPHLSEQIPSIWYEIGLHCSPVGPDCPFNVVGFSFAGDPGVIIGHNDRIGWGFTNVGPDVQDLYIEKINPANPNQYEVNGKWVDMQIVQETIKIAGGKSEPLTVRYTRHGPLITDTYGDLKDFNQTSGIDLPQQYAIALRWTALEPNYLFTAILGFDRAQNWDDFRKAASFFAVPAQNLVYADVDGNIGYQMPGNIPMRARGDGRLPVPGWTDEYEWTGYIPFEQLPFAFNPPQGFIATANNAVVGADYPYLITTDWDYGYRAQRIVDMIRNAPGPITPEYIQQIQGDDQDQIAQALVPLLMQIPLDDARLEKARAILQGWDYQDRMDSAPAGLFAAFWKHLLADAFGDDLPQDFQPVGSSRWFEVVQSIAAQPEDPWWDNRATQAVENRDAIFRQAFQEAVNVLESRLGKDPAKWKWGDLHTLTFHNQTLGMSGVAPIEAIFNRGAFRASGGSSIVNATGWNAAKGFQVATLPSMRMIVDFSDLSNSLTIHTTGESGHAYHPHYVDMANLWRQIQYHPMLWERSQVEQNAEGRLKLAPQ